MVMIGRAGRPEPAGLTAISRRQFPPHAGTAAERRGCARRRRARRLRENPGRRRACSGAQDRCGLLRAAMLTFRPPRDVRGRLRQPSPLVALVAPTIPARVVDGLRQRAGEAVLRLARVMKRDLVQLVETPVASEACLHAGVGLGRPVLAGGGADALGDLARDCQQESGQAALFRGHAKYLLVTRELWTPPTTLNVWFERSWRWRESNPRPSVPHQGFSGRSLLCFSQPRRSRKQVADGLSRCEVSRLAPRPGQAVDPPC